MINLKDMILSDDLKNIISSDKFFSLLINNTQDIFYFFTMEGKLLFVNYTFEEVTGYTTEELYTKNFYAFVHPEDYERTIEFWKRFRKEKLFEDVDYRIIKKNGDIRWSTSSWRVVKDKDGNEIGILGKQKDITDRVNQKIEHTKKQFEAESQNKVKSNFLANISHEIRTPIAAVVGFTDLLMLFPELTTEKRVQYIESIHSSSKHLQKLLEEILDFSKIDSDAMAFETIEVNSKEFFLKAYNAFECHASTKGLDYKLIFLTKIPENINIDPTRIMQVIFNLISNAMNFTKKGYVKIDVSFSSKLNEIVVDVQDSGIGIPRDQQRTLFNPYDQLNIDITREYGGTGLGLCLSRKIIEKLGGRLQLISTELHKGSHFKCKFPVGNSES